MPPQLRAVCFTLVQVVLWMVALPAMVLVGELGEFRPVWQPWQWLALATVAGLAGLALTWSGASRLARAGVGLAGVAPGPRLVSDGLYGYLRHPIDAGIVLLAAAPALALAIRQVWIVPVAALVYLGVGYEPFEERRLAEAFGEEYDEYRSRVPRWFPRDPA